MYLERKTWDGMWLKKDLPTQIQGCAPYFAALISLMKLRKDPPEFIRQHGPTGLYHWSCTWKGDFHETLPKSNTTNKSAADVTTVAKNDFERLLEFSNDISQSSLGPINIAVCFDKASKIGSTKNAPYDMSGEKLENAPKTGLYYVKPSTILKNRFGLFAVKQMFRGRVLSMMVGTECHELGRPGDRPISLEEIEADGRFFLREGDFFCRASSGKICLLRHRIRRYWGSSDDPLFLGAQFAVEASDISNSSLTDIIPDDISSLKPNAAWTADGRLVCLKRMLQSEEIIVAKSIQRIGIAARVQSSKVYKTEDEYASHFGMKLPETPTQQWVILEEIFRKSSTTKVPLVNCISAEVIANEKTTSSSKDNKRKGERQEQNAKKRSIAEESDCLEDVESLTLPDAFLKCTSDGMKNKLAAALKGMEKELQRVMVPDILNALLEEEEKNSKK